MIRSGRWNRKSDVPSPGFPIHASTLPRVFYWTTIARLEICFPWNTSQTRNCTKSHARSLLSMPRLNIERSRTHAASCRWMRMAQISLSLNRSFCPVDLPLFHGTLTEPLSPIVFVTISFQVKGDPVCAD